MPHKRRRLLKSSTEKKLDKLKIQLSGKKSRTRVHFNGEISDDNGS